MGLNCSPGFNVHLSALSSSDESSLHRFCHVIRTVAVAGGVVVVVVVSSAMKGLAVVVMVVVDAP